MNGRINHDWQDRDYVLHGFGKTEKIAIKSYRTFVADGIATGRRHELVGRGLVRSMGGWSPVISLRRHGDRELADERILDSGDFVQRILDEAEERQKHYFSASDRRRRINYEIAEICKEEDINMRELQAGSRRRIISHTRSRIAQ